MTILEIKTSLSESLRGIADFLQQCPETAWHRSQEGKWTIAQEVEHILIANSGTARLLSPPGRTIWRPGAQPSRTYDAIKDEYLAGLAANPGINNPATNPSAESAQKTLQQQLSNWQRTSQALLSAVDAISEVDLDEYTVWKHPFLGPFTVREMLYFTDYHTRHHTSILKKKQEG